MSVKKVFSALLAIMLAACMCPAAALAASGPREPGLAAGKAALEPQAATLAMGSYSYSVGDFDSWGSAPGTSKPGYTLSLSLIKKKGNSITFQVSQTYFYGVTGFYHVASKNVTAKLKGGSASFKFRTNAGDQGNGKLKVVSKNKVKVSVKTTKAGQERIALSTGGKYKTLTHAQLGTQGSSAKDAKARKAYKAYLAKHGRVKYFKVASLGNDGVPVLLCTKSEPVRTPSSRYFISADVMVYSASSKENVRKVGTVTTGGTACQLCYAKGKLCGYRIAGLHTVACATVKEGRLTMSGMYDNYYVDEWSFRHFSGYDPAWKNEVGNTEALGKRGTAAQYSKLVQAYTKKKLNMLSNTAANRQEKI